MENKITLTQVETLPNIKITEANLDSVITKATENARIIIAKDGKKFVFDGNEVFYYSDGKNIFVIPMEQDFDKLKELIG